MNASASQQATSLRYPGFTELPDLMPPTTYLSRSGGSPDTQLGGPDRRHEPARRTAASGSHPSSREPGLALPSRTPAARTGSPPEDRSLGHGTKSVGSSAD